MSPVAIITGSDSGIGQESAKALAEAGNGGRAINITSVNKIPRARTVKTNLGSPVLRRGRPLWGFSRLWRSAKSALRP
jgi:hypothetical protein